MLNEKCEEYNIKKSPIECICPNCQNKHISEIIWTGNGIPRIFCKHCKHSSIMNEVNIQTSSKGTKVSNRIKEFNNT